MKAGMNSVHTTPQFLEEDRAQRGTVTHPEPNSTCMASTGIEVQGCPTPELGLVAGSSRVWNASWVWGWPGGRLSFGVAGLAP